MSNRYEDEARDELLDQLYLFRKEDSGFDMILEEDFEIYDISELDKVSVPRLQKIVNYFDDIL